MIREVTALCWAVAIILLAVGASTGVVEGEAARTLFMVLPLIAWLSLRGDGCGFSHEARR